MNNYSGRGVPLKITTPLADAHGLVSTINPHNHQKESLPRAQSYNIPSILLINSIHTLKMFKVSVSRNPETVLGSGDTTTFVFVSCIDLTQSRLGPISVQGLGDYWAPSPMLVVPLLQRFHPVAVHWVLQLLLLGLQDPQPLLCSPPTLLPGMMACSLW